jgi:DNA helicase-2/ATP-dependent DNA helicase PcrA
VVLANRVIAPSRDRHPKTLVTTRGFAGLTALRRAPDATSIGRRVVGDVRAALDAGFRGAEIAVLVRLTAQTPLIEQPLIEAGIPYRLVGEEPFFRRREIVDLLRYVDLADYDATLRAGQRLDGHAQEDFVAAWQQLYNRPKRYFTRQFCQEIAQSVTRAGRPLSVLLQEAANRGAHRNPDTLRDLADLLRWLAAAGQRLPAADLLRELDQRLGYQDFLIKHSGFASTGAGKAANVVAFIEYAQGKGKLDVLRTHLAELDARRTVIEEGNPDVVELRTIHRAKGLEWPVVLVPNCNPGFFPASAATDIEEERRVLYVALTRAKAQLVLYAVHGGDTVVSPFLIAAQADITLARSAEIAATLASDPLSWTAQQALSLLIFPRQYAQERFFTHWWAVPAELQQRCVSRLLAFVQQLAARDALDTLDVAESDVAFWRSIGPAFLPPDAAPFAKLDALLATRATVQPARHTTSAPYRVGDAVTHPKFGQGVVRQINTVVERGKTDWHLNVDFHSAGRKKLLASLAPLRRVGT